MKKDKKKRILCWSVDKGTISQSKQYKGTYDTVIIHTYDRSIR